MEEQNFFEQKPTKATGMLNVLTILTFIGSGIQLLGGVWQYLSADKSVAEMEKLMNDPNMANMPGFMKGLMSPEALQLAKLQAANKLPILALNVIGAIICIYAALEMRKLKKQGYLLYVVGELLPMIGMVILIGTGIMTGAFWFGIAIAALFIILYTTQRKQLIN